MNFCAECDSPITDQSLVIAINRRWHDDCLRCACCKCRLIDQSDRFYFKDGLCLCAWHYARLFGIGGTCHLCAGQVGPSEWVVCVRSDRTSTQLLPKCFSRPPQKSIFHLQCFACAKCDGRFCVGDPFTFSRGVVICQRHFAQE